MSTLSPQDVADLIELEECMWRAATRFDLAFQEARFAPDFVEYGRSGRAYSRADAIRTAGEEIGATLPLINLNVRALHRDIAQVTYISKVTYRNGIEYARRSSIWSRTAMGWTMRFHQGTPFEPSDIPM